MEGNPHQTSRPYPIPFNVQRSPNQNYAASHGHPPPAVHSSFQTGGQGYGLFATRGAPHHRSIEQPIGGYGSPSPVVRPESSRSEHLQARSIVTPSASSSAKALLPSSTSTTRIIPEHSTLPDGTLGTSNSPSEMSVLIQTPKHYPIVPGKTSKTQGKSSLMRVEITSATPKKSSSTSTSKSHIPSQALNILPKKRGRPFANPEAALKAQMKAQVKAPKRQRKMEANGNAPYAKKKGRPFKQIPQHIEVPVPVFNYPIFHCQFAGCPAELINAERLRAHLLNVHGKKRDRVTKAISCLWTKGPHICCVAQAKESVRRKAEEAKALQTQTKEFSSDEDEPAMPKLVLSQLDIISKQEFSTFDDYKAHVEEKHISPVRRALGDGPPLQDLWNPPRNNPSLYEREPWLFDKDGKQVTPEVDMSLLDYGIAKETNAERFTRRKEDGEWVYELRDTTSVPVKKKGRPPKNKQTKSELVDDEDED